MTPPKNLLAVVAIVVFCHASLAESDATEGFHPCCSFPCQNQGVCSSRGYSDYECDCTRTGFYGRNCEHATLLKSVELLVRPSPETLHHLLVNYEWLWDIVSYLGPLHRFFMKRVYLSRADNVDTPPIYTSRHEYITMEAAFNLTYYARTLPPVHENCPTPMGVAGKKLQPDAGVVTERLFRRDIFKPSPLNSNVLLPAFAQYFTHQFFKTDKDGPQYQWGGHGVDGSHIYGNDKEASDILRSFRGGRLKSQLLKGEEYPPYLKDAPVHMTYPPNTPDRQKFAIGHEFYGLLPSLFLYSTVWLREHNRVAAILSREHPDWADEQIFQTTKLVIIGETIQVVVNDYVQHLSNYHIRVAFIPDVLFDTPFQYQNRIALEFNHLYHWHPMMPDDVTIGGRTYSMSEQMFHPEIVVEHGVAATTEALASQISGAMTFRNHGNATLSVAKEIILAGRQLRLQSFNQYRKRFHLAPYENFYDLTGNQEMADAMEELYGDIDAVEFYVGLVMEKAAEKAKFGLGILEMGASYSVKGLMSNPICSPEYWKASTFGGQVGFDIVKHASLETVFCQNIRGKCPHVSFELPEELISEQPCTGGGCKNAEL
uniref:prostaglandin-endoperoxide synthase n=1 Tax=Simrothiella margaritacea TaxID=669227 RepID=A0A0U2I2E6_9MOLL|nr:cyclooxygenase [Simrothiella margaritacea]